MIIQLPHGLAPSSQMIPWLAPRLPRYRIGSTVGYTTVSSGMWISIMIRPHQQGAKLVNGMPIVPRMLMTFGFLGGIIPGLLFAAIYFGICSGVWSRMHNEIASVLRGEVEPASGALSGGATPSTPLLSEAQSNTLKRYALPAVAWLLFLPASGCAVSAWNSGHRMSYAQGNLTCVDETRALLKQDLAWARAGGEPPNDCPEKKLAPKQDDRMCAYETTVSSSECHHSSLSSVEPSPYAGYSSTKRRVIKRGDVFWALPTPETLQSRLSRLQSVERQESSDRNRALIMAVFYFVFALGSVAAGMGCLFWWLRQEKQRVAAPVPLPLPV